MNKLDQNRFKKILLAVGATYDKKLDEDLVRIWWNLFKPYSIDVFDKAISKHFLDPGQGMFMPKPANIIKQINSSELSVETKADMAWSEILEKISSIGSYGNLELEDKQALATVKALGGWKNLCSKTTAHLVWERKEFISIYQNYETTSIEMLPEHLPGRLELETHKKSTSVFFKQLEQKKSELGVK